MLCFLLLTVVAAKETRLGAALNKRGPRERPLKINGASDGDIIAKSIVLGENGEIKASRDLAKEAQQPVTALPGLVV